jgi:hypothetical protein
MTLIQSFQGVDFASFCFLGSSVILMCGSLLEMLSVTFRESIQRKVAAELPENRAFFDSEQGIAAAKRRRLVMLLLGIALFIVWLLLLRHLL